MLRYYEERGLLAPRRLANGYRVYERGDVARVLQVRELFAHGLTSDMVLTTPRYLAMLATAEGIEAPETAAAVSVVSVPRETAAPR